MSTPRTWAEFVARVRELLDRKQKPRPSERDEVAALYTRLRADLEHTHQRADKALQRLHERASR